MNQLITVAIPVTRVLEIAEQAINSIVQQSYRNISIILQVEKGYADLDLVSKYLNDNRVTIVQFPENTNLATKCNEAIKHCNTKYFARMDDDDISLPYRLQKQLSLMERNPDVDICGCSVCFFGEDSKIYVPAVFHQDIVIRLLNGSSIPHSSWLMRTGKIQELELVYNQELEFAQDYDFLVRCKNILKYQNISEILVKLRTHINQSSKNIKQSEISDIVRTNLLKELRIPESEIIVWNSFINSKELDQESITIANNIIASNKTYKTFNQSKLKLYISYLLGTKISTYFQFKLLIDSKIDNFLN